jgi:hypothetical protein
VCVCVWLVYVWKVCVCVCDRCMSGTCGERVCVSVSVQVWVKITEKYCI